MCIALQKTHLALCLQSPSQKPCCPFNMLLFNGTALMGADNQRRIQNLTGFLLPPICSDLCDLTKGCFTKLVILTHIF